MDASTVNTICPEHLALNNDSIIHLILNKHFPWVYTPSGHPGFDLEDLLQIGRLALWDAAQHYDPHHNSGAKFFTYAQHHVYHSLAREMAQSTTALSKPYAYNTNKQRHTEELADKADCCFRFSELIDPSAISEDECDLDFVLGKLSASFACQGNTQEIDNEDELQYYLAKLHANLQPDELTLLLERARGATWKTLAQPRGCSQRTIRRWYQEALKRAREILADVK